LTSDGAAAEKLAASYLQQNGLVLLESNFSCRFGEIDLILQDAGVIVFAEVRLRTHSSFGGAAASITPAKQARIVKAAQIYLQQLHRQPQCRFDVLLLHGLDVQQIEWIRNAFEA
jgi:putative endonuclease